MKTKTTKRPKKVILHLKEIRAYRTSYICPACKTEYIGEHNKNVLRFRCPCGQELIVEATIRDKNCDASN